MPSTLLLVLALSLLVHLAVPGAHATFTKRARGHRHLRTSSTDTSLSEEPAATAEVTENDEDSDDGEDDEDGEDDADDTEAGADDNEGSDMPTSQQCMVMKKGMVSPSLGTYYPGSPDGVDIQEIPVRTGDLAPSFGMFCEAKPHHCYMIQRGANVPVDGQFFPGGDEVQKILVQKGAVAPQVGLFCSGVGANTTAQEDVGSQLEKARLQQDVLDAHDALVANLRKQVEVNGEIKHLDDEAALHKEVDNSVEAVANETQSQAMANFLGDMWKEMRMFAKPFYKEHLEEQLAGLEGKGRLLQSAFNETQAALTAWHPKVELPSGSQE